MAKKPRAPREIEVPLETFPTIEHPRPIPLSAVIGQERALGLLNDALKSERIHHCWIFHGPEGVGKFTSALAFAALLQDPTTQATFSGAFEADPESHVQQLLRAGTHPDLHIIVKELAKYHEDLDVRKKKLTNISIDVIRDFVVEPAKLAPSLRTQSRAGKVFIIDQAELLDDGNNKAQNALLKVLEEPPERAVIILVTSSEDRLLPTIRSRSQRVYFRALSQPEMHGWLKKAGLELPADEREWLLEFAQGSPGALTTAHSMGVHAWWKKIGPLLAGAAKGQYALELGPAMHELADSWAKEWVEDNENASKEAANKTASDWMFRLIGVYLQRRLAEAARGGDAVSATRPYLVMLDKLREAEAEMDANVNSTFVMEKLSAEIAAAGE